MTRVHLLPLLALALAACAGAADPISGSPQRLPDGAPIKAAPASQSGTSESISEAPAPNSSTSPAAESAGLDPSQINKRVSDPNTYRIPRMIPPDGIAPIYDPLFASAQEAPLLDDELVIGVERQGEAKAYPISVLRFREMVNDELGDWPILVTW